jgi:hypothetical protein
MLWIGHPWTFVRSSGDALRFLEPNECEEADGLKETMSLPRAALLDAVDRAFDARNHFAKRLLPVVQSLRPRIAALDIVEVLVRGHAQLA